MAVEIVDFPIKNGGSFHSYVKLPEGRCKHELIWSWLSHGEVWAYHLHSPVGSSTFPHGEAMNTSERGYNLFVIFFSLLVVGAAAGIP